MIKTSSTTYSRACSIGPSIGITVILFELLISPLTLKFDKNKNDKITNMIFLISFLLNTHLQFV